LISGFIDLLIYRFIDLLGLTALQHITGHSVP